MSDIQSMAETACSGRPSDDEAKAESLRFTPLRSYATRAREDEAKAESLRFTPLRSYATRAREPRDELTFSRLIPVPRLQS